MSLHSTKNFLAACRPEIVFGVRAEAQHHKVETKRLDAARIALRPVAK